MVPHEHHRDIAIRARLTEPSENRGGLLVDAPHDLYLRHLEYK